MSRCTLLLLVVSACGSAAKPVARSAPGDGVCREPGGCAAPIDPETRYVPPDVDHLRPPVDAWDAGGSKAVEASCSDVATTLAALDLGNWADEEKLAPLAARYEGQCKKLKLSKDERQCVFESTDKPSVTYCAPRMMPGAQIAIVAAAECPRVAEDMRALMGPQGGAQPLWLKQLAAIQTSCEQDRWTHTFRDCVRNVPVPGYVSAYCGNAAPAPLRKKLDERLALVK